MRNNLIEISIKDDALWSVDYLMSKGFEFIDNHKLLLDFRTKVDDHFKKQGIDEDIEIFWTVGADNYVGLSEELAERGF